MSTANLERLGRQVRGLGIPFDAATIVSSIERVGSWVGGNAYVFHDRVVFSMNWLNARFQEDISDVVVPASMIGDVRFGKMLMFAKTVDCAFMGATLRFRCSSKNNDRLLDSIRSVVNKV